MLDFETKKDKKTSKKWIETSLRGKPLLTTPQLNKGTAFTEAERQEFGLVGKLPPKIETLDEQVARCYRQYSRFNDILNKNVFLNDVNEINQTLFYRLVLDHLEEMMPVIYTPIVGSAVKKFSREFRNPRGLYLSHHQQDDIESILANRSNPEIDIIVVTDGEGVLGIGDQGIGGMAIPFAKLMVYCLCAGIDPNRTLPILLDVGTNNEKLLDDPMYLGCRERRIDGKQYHQFIEKFVSAIENQFPDVFLHWEDLGRDNARHSLEQCKDRICSFNDDMQGTGVVTLSALNAALAQTHSTELSEHRIVVFGAGTAGTGISDQIHTALMREGLSAEEAYQRFWLIDKNGLLTDNQHLNQAQKPYARRPDEVANWTLTSGNFISLHDTITNAQPTILIGCSSVYGAFNENIIKEMAKHTARPIIFPLSNPTENSEAKPQDLLDWTEGRALVATGSPFDDCLQNGNTVRIAQCNNALVFPGLGLGVVASQARELTDNMLWAAQGALSEAAPVHNSGNSPLLPSLGNARSVAKNIALAVASQAIRDGVAGCNIDDNLETLISGMMWEPEYSPLKYKAKNS